MMRTSRWLFASFLLLLPSLSQSKPTPGYPERVFQWTVQKGETCNHIAKAMYGSPRHRRLLERYNSVSCAGNKPLAEGMTLVVPERVTTLPTARLRGLKPAVKARAPGAGWSPASPGMPLVKRHAVNTQEKARADILFVDRTRVVLAEHTLVVIYGTAASTAVSKTPPPKVELEQGEVQAGLAALRGNRSVGVRVKSGGDVSAKSRDTVVRTQKSRTTVSVFDGTSKVSSAGKSVSVNEGFGSSFEAKKPPTPPRKLPPSPTWAAGSAQGVVLLPKGSGRLFVAWKPIKEAKTYRVELARDAAFKNLVAREEIPARINALKAERLPPGRYYARVRAIDKDDFLGLASTPRPIHLIEVDVVGAAQAISKSALKVNRYSTVELRGGNELLVALDKGPYGKNPGVIDLSRIRPKKIRLRVPGSKTPSEISLQYSPLEAELNAERSKDGTSATVQLKLSGLGQVDQPKVVAPTLTIGQSTAGNVPFLFQKGVFTAALSALDPDEDLTLRVLDRRGEFIAEANLPAREAAPLAPPKTEPLPGIGPTAPVIPIAPWVSTRWWAPGTHDAASVGIAVATVDDEPQMQASLAGETSLGAVGLEGRVTSDGFFADNPEADSAAWFGARYRLESGENVEFGPALRFGIPMTDRSPAARAELGLGLGLRGQRVDWLFNLSYRLRAADTGERFEVPRHHLLGMLGLSYKLTERSLFYAALDGHGLFLDPSRFRGGLLLGAEFGGPVFVSLGGRLSPWKDTGLAQGQFSLGLRR